MTGALAAPAPTASAATGAVGYFMDGGLTVLGGMDPGNGQISYCINVGIGSPIGGATEDAGVVGSVNGLDAGTMSRLNYLLSKYGNTADNNQAAAVALAVWQLADAANFEAEGGVGYKITIAPADQRAAILDSLANINADIAAFDPNANNVTADIRLNVDPTNNYVGSVSIAVPPPSATVSLSLVNGGFDGNNGLPTASGSGWTSLAVHGVPPTDDGAPYKITGHWAVDAAGGYAPNVHLYTTPGAQNITAQGTAGTSHLEGDFFDPQDRSVKFQPVGTTQVQQKYVESGDFLEDLVQPATAADAAGLNNPWYKSPASGSFAPVKYVGTAYGPFDEKPATSAEIPADAPVFGHASFTTTTTDGPNVGYSARSDTKVTESGYYTWVWKVAAADQAAGVQLLVPEGYAWQDAFGQATETAFVIPSVTTQAKPEILLGGPEDATDTIIVDGVLPEGSTTGSNAYQQAPGTTQPICDDSTLVFESKPQDAPSNGQVTTDGFMPETIGDVNWVEWVKDGDGHTIATGECGAPGETTKVTQLVVTTKATPDVYTGDDATDVTILTGTVLPGDELTFIAYHQNGDKPADTDTVACDLSANPIVLKPGVYTGEEIKSETCSFADAGTYYWVETVTNKPTDTVVHRGERGADHEWTNVKPRPEVPVTPAGFTPTNLASTGNAPAPLLGIAGGLLGAGLLTVAVLLVIQRRRATATASTPKQ